MDTYEIKLGKHKITIASIPARQFWRTQSYPPTVDKPTPPEGYTHEQAIENIPDYADAVAAYSDAASYQSACRAVGAARAQAIDGETGMPAARAEAASLRKAFVRKSIRFPDDLDDPVEIGGAIFEMAAETGDSRGVMEAYLWLQEKSGGVDPALIAEAMKRLRGDSERAPDIGGAGPSQG